ncbi:MAG: dephospho-CoA kinase [Desulfuromonadales bacterium]|nr:dephospho-CoA kinase [Desulfuromonadales bacterium]
MTLVLGLTGGIASGKSSVAAMFAEFGAEVVSADQLAREAVAPGSATLQALAAAFGPAILDPAGELDREALARMVFADPAARERLNAVTHPAIARLAEARLRDLRARKVPLVVYEAPLLFEAGAERRVDRVLVVTIDPTPQRARLQDRDQLDATAIEARISAQWPQADKVARADFVIDNSGTLDETRRQVAALCHFLLSGGQR